MRLSADPVKLSRISADELREAIAERRAAIRAHRDAKGDDRCWLDDFLVWGLLDYAPQCPVSPPPHAEAMEKCRAFHAHRNASAPDPVPESAVLDERKWDADIEVMSHARLVQELVKLQAAIRVHSGDKGRPHTAEDDRDLYVMLPERLPADFRLPPENEFLGEAKAPHAGCPAFWRSHGDCASARHDLHRWGPCRKD